MDWSIGGEVAAAAQLALTWSSDSFSGLLVEFPLLNTIASLKLNLIKVRLDTLQLW